MFCAIWEFAPSRDCVRILRFPRLRITCAQSRHCVRHGDWLSSPGLKRITSSYYYCDLEEWAMLCIDEQRKRSRSRSKFAVDRTLLPSAYMPHATGSIECILSKCGSDSWSVPLLKLSANFCCVLIVIFRHCAGTRVSSVVAYSDFICMSADYILSKAGLQLRNL